VLEAGVEELAEDCVSAGSAEISWARLVRAENVKTATREQAAKKRGRTKERTIDEQFPLNRADPTGKLHRVFPSGKMTGTRKRFATRKSAVQWILIRLADAQFQYIPKTAAPFHAHMNARICLGVYERSFHSTRESTRNHKTPTPKNALMITSWKNQ
jgi:hypothetical protein